MKRLVLLLFVVAVCSAGVLKDPTKSYEDGNRSAYSTADRDSSHSNNVKELNHDDELMEESALSNVYWLFTRSNPTAPQILTYKDSHSIFSSNFDNGKQTIYLAHGWRGDGTSHYNEVMTKAFLDSADVNVVVLDWNYLADQNYVNAKRATPVAGKMLGDFINWIATLGVSYDNMHLVGFSLGAHLVGCAGRETGGKVARVTALDPAGPLWVTDPNRVVATDGKYVEVIHTNTAFMGITTVSGDTDFYPNGGIYMPGCDNNLCSHDRAYEYMAAMLRYNHLFANMCDSYIDAVLNKCSGPLEPMGDVPESSESIQRKNIHFNDLINLFKNIRNQLFSYLLNL